MWFICVLLLLEWSSRSWLVIKHFQKAWKDVEDQSSYLNAKTLKLTLAACSLPEWWFLAILASK